MTSIRGFCAQAGYDIRLDSWDTSATHSAATAALIAEQRLIVNVCLTYNPGSVPTVDGRATQPAFEQAHEQMPLPESATEEMPASHAGVTWRQVHVAPP